MTELSDTEVFGTPAPAKEMSDAEVFGAAPERINQSTRMIRDVPVPAALSDIAALQFNKAKGLWRDQTTGTVYDAKGNDILKATRSIDDPNWVKAIVAPVQGALDAVGLGGHDPADDEPSK